MSDNNAYLGLFLDEARENLETLNHSLLTLEKQPGDKPTLDAIFRVAHTLKGMAAAMGFEGFKDLTHKMEDLFGAFKENQLEQVPEDMDLLFASLDALSQDLELITEGEYNNTPHQALCDKLVARLEGGNDSPAQSMSTQAETEANTNISIGNNNGALNVLPAEVLQWKNTTIEEQQKSNPQDLYFLEVKLAEDCSLPSIRAFMVLDVLKNADCEIISSHPSLDEASLDCIDSKVYYWLFSHAELKREEDQVQLKQVLASITEVTSVELDVIYLFDAKENSSREEKNACNEKNEKPVDAATQGKTVRIPMQRIDGLVDLVGELVISRTRLIEFANRTDEKDLLSILHAQSTITNELQELVMKFRMEPIEKMFSRFPRVIRDLSKTLGKNIDLQMLGEDTEVDRVVNEELGGALIHLVRNAIDHGVEMPDVRLARGKRETGLVELSASNLGDAITICIRDDGKGLNREKLIESAIKKNLITAEQGRQMSDREAFNLVFMAGFSTAEVTTDVSGRGVGMDVVKTTIDKLGGQIDIQSKENEGTSFIISLPTSMAIINVLLVSVKGECYALPLASIREIIDLPASELRGVGRSEMLMVRGEPLPIIRLRDVVQDNTKDVEAKSTVADRDHVLAVIVRLHDQYFCLEVDDLIGQQEAVVKPLPSIVSGCTLYSGVMILGNGDIVLIMNPVTLFYKNQYQNSNPTSASALNT